MVIDTMRWSTNIQRVFGVQEERAKGTCRGFELHLSWDLLLLE